MLDPNAYESDEGGIEEESKKPIPKLHKLAASSSSGEEEDSFELTPE